MASKNNAAISGLTLIMLACMIQSVQAKPNLSQYQVVTIAQRFSKGITDSTKSLATVAGTYDKTLLPKIDYHEPDKAPDDPTNEDIIAIIGNHPHAYWHLEQPRNFEMEIDDATGFVKSYVNYSATDDEGDKPAGEAIPKSQALELAKAAIKATGASLDDLAFSGIGEYQNSDPPKSDGHEWYICWLRTYRGIPYRREGAGVFLAAETGKVISVRVDAQSIDPVTATENVTREQALTVAQAQLNAVALSLSELPLLSAEKKVVPFNTFWQSGDEEHHTLQTRVVWICSFGVPEDNYEVWVDAETGNVVGGYHVASLGGGGKRLSPKFGHQLKHSEAHTKFK